MRVIAGKYRGKRLASPADNSVRPTTDRIKETVFNILCNRYGIGERVLDLFCGSGALGIEALSRGATYAAFVDKSPKSIELARENLRGVGERYDLFNTDFRVALSKFTQPFDLILIDPPYADKREEEALRLIDEYGLLRKDGVIFVEHSRENSLINLPASYIIDTRQCGHTDISFVVRAEEEHA